MTNCREYENWFECVGLYAVVTVGNLFTELEDEPDVFTTCVDACYESGCQWSGNALLTVHEDGSVTAEWEFIEDGPMDEGGDFIDVSDLPEQEAAEDLDRLARTALEYACEWLAQEVKAE